MADLNETMMIAIIAVLAGVFVGLWMFNSQQKRKFEEAQRQRKRDLAELKAKASQKAESDE